MERNLFYKYREVVADAGYESVENYLFIEEKGQLSYIKPANYEISKTKKYLTDIERHENMDYDAVRDMFTRINEKELLVVGTRTSKSTSRYRSTATIYRYNDCKGCPYKEKCIKGNNSKAQWKNVANSCMYLK